MGALSSQNVETKLEKTFLNTSAANKNKLSPLSRSAISTVFQCLDSAGGKRYKTLSILVFLKLLKPSQLVCPHPPPTIPSSQKLVVEQLLNINGGFLRDGHVSMDILYRVWIVERTQVFSGSPFTLVLHCVMPQRKPVQRYMHAVKGCKKKNSLDLCTQSVIFVWRVFGCLSQ